MTALRRRPPEAAVVRGRDKLVWLKAPIPLVPGSPVVIVAYDVMLTLDLPRFLVDAVENA
jgi:hypothetical protein